MKSKKDTVASCAACRNTDSGIDGPQQGGKRTEYDAGQSTGGNAENTADAKGRYVEH